jgi:RNA polymerase sigma-70 factor (ECF subfamily)
MRTSLAGDEEITRYALRAAQGDEAAAERFVASTQVPLYRLLRHLSNPGVAEDLTQETYLRAFASLPGFAAQCPARLWLLAIARRVAADHLRTASRRPRTSALDWDTMADAVSPPVADHARAVVVQELVAGLEIQRREAFVLTQVLGLSYEEAAAVCECAVGTIRSRVFRAREELADALRAPQVSATKAGSR